MLFVGEEYGASAPWQFLTAHPEPELGEAVAEARQSSRRSTGPRRRAAQDPQTFSAASSTGPRSTRVTTSSLPAYRDLIALRRTAQLAEPALGRVAAQASDGAVVRAQADQRAESVHGVVVAINLGDEPQPATHGRGRSPSCRQRRGPRAGLEGTCARGPRNRRGAARLEPPAGRPNPHDAPGTTAEGTRAASPSSVRCAEPSSGELVPCSSMATTPSATLPTARDHAVPRGGPLRAAAVSLGLWHRPGRPTRGRDARHAAPRIRPGHHHFEPGQATGPPAGSAELNSAGSSRRSSRAPPRARDLHQGRVGRVARPYGDVGSRQYLVTSLDQS
ncbi:DUF3459 domain-containing protein [Kocuria rhizophila]|nr:DUF3459 domain-containing protein [Kocuria rhizophila]